MSDRPMIAIVDDDASVRRAAGRLRKPFDRRTVLDAIERAIQVERTAGPTVTMASGHGTGIA